MALIRCTECGKVFSDQADKCPECSCPTENILKELERQNNGNMANINPNRNPKKKSNGKTLIICFIILLIIAIAAAVGMSYISNHNANPKQDHSGMDSTFIADSIKRALENAKDEVAAQLEKCPVEKNIYYVKFKRDVMCTSDEMGDTVEFKAGEIISKNISKDQMGDFNYKTKDGVKVTIPKNAIEAREYQAGSIPTEILNKYILLFKNQYDDNLTVKKKKGSSRMYVLSYGADDILVSEYNGNVSFAGAGHSEDAPIFVPSQRAFMYHGDLYYLNEIVPLEDD